MSGSRLTFCSIDEAWGNKEKQTSPDNLYDTKTRKSENAENKNLNSTSNDVDRFSENHNGVLRKASGPSAANASIRGIKPMEYGAKHSSIDDGNLNPFFKQIIDNYKKENVELRELINELRNEVEILKNHDSLSTESTLNTIQSVPNTPKSINSFKRQKSNSLQKKKVYPKEETLNMSHVPFGMEPEVFNIFIFSFFAIMFLLFIDKSLTGKGVKIF